MNRSRLRRVLASAVLGIVSTTALAQQQQRQDDSNRPPAPRPAAPIPQDSRVPIPKDSRAPLGSSGLQGLPPASERMRQPVDPPRNTAPPPRPGSEPQDLRGDINRARQLEADARRRYGLPSGGGGGGDRPWHSPRPYPRPYRDYWTDRYWYDPPYVGGPYDDGGFNDPRNGEPRDAGDAADGPSRVPDLPPDEVLADEDVTPALQKALDAAPEWKQATADLIRAWGAYADAADAVLADLQDQSDYRRARVELRRAKDRLEAVQAGAAAAPGQARQAGAEAPPDRLLGAADAALKARRAVRRLESGALATDPDVQRAERRLDNSVDRRNEIRDKIAAKLPAADRPAAPSRPKLLDDE